ncbi:hypothetical protein DY000_02050093 [Brassica cretica]|uniref:DUF4005 domain-containing protein n=1 Tax=Brassica cretica TaxID=69181 RepID=A0ABQ7EXL0_BRACR|nr:hypothetical protein DY000_02050093 [Brassica cretica]
MSRKEMKPIANKRARKRRFRGPGDRGAVTKIAEQVRRSRDQTSDHYQILSVDLSSLDQTADDLTRSQSRPISPTPLAQTREEVTELRGMVSSLIDFIHNQWIANQTTANRLDHAERELAEYRAANAPERNQTPLDPLKGASNFQNTGLFGTPEIPNARSGCYTREKSQQSPSQGMTHRSLSYSEMDEINTGLQRPRSTPIQFQNGSTERQEKPRTRIPPQNHSIPENRTPSATRTLHQAGFDNLTEQARRHTLRAPVIGPKNVERRFAVRTKIKKNQRRNRRGRGITSDSQTKPKIQSLDEQNRKGNRAGVTELPTTSSEEKSRHVFVGAKQQHNRRNQEPNRRENIHRGHGRIRTLEKSDEATPPPSVTQYNPNTESPCGKIPNFKRKNKMTKIHKLLEKPNALQI